MYNINLFIFSNNKGEEKVFVTANEAEDYFKEKEYDMSEWKIRVDYSDSGNDEISLKTFNYILGVQKEMDYLKARIKALNLDLKLFI